MGVEETVQSQVRGLEKVYQRRLREYLTPLVKLPESPEKPH